MNSKEKKKHMDTERKPLFNWNIYKSSKQAHRISSNRKAKKSNLGKGERQSLKELSGQTDVLIRKADKGGAVVIWETKDYKEPNWQPNLTSNYKKLTNYPTVSHNKLINDAIDWF